MDVLNSLFSNNIYGNLTKLLYKFYSGKNCRKSCVEYHYCEVCKRVVSRTNLTKHDSSYKYSILYHGQNDPSILIKTCKTCN